MAPSPVKEPGGESSKTLMGDRGRGWCVICTALRDTDGLVRTGLDLRGALLRLLRLISAEVKSGKSNSELQSLCTEREPNDNSSSSSCISISRRDEVDRERRLETG